MIQNKAFTLIETLVAVSLLSVAIVAPMSLASHSLAAAYYARDQITAYHLAQEAIEALRSIRDGQILTIAQSSTGASTNIFGPLVDKILVDDEPFTIDARLNDPDAAIVSCSGGPCAPLQTDGTLYGYSTDSTDSTDWTDTHFTRTVRAHFIGSGEDEIRVTVEVSWRAGAANVRTFSISADLYRWVNDGSSQI
jgi:prepilin-type N-terminal cleavage/methylation domain-containing protein